MQKLFEMQRCNCAEQELNAQRAVMQEKIFNAQRQSYAIKIFNARSCNCAKKYSVRKGATMQKSPLRKGSKICKTQCAEVQNTKISLCAKLQRCKQIYSVVLKLCKRIHCTKVSILSTILTSQQFIKTPVPFSDKLQIPSQQKDRLPHFFNENKMNRLFIHLIHKKVEKSDRSTITLIPSENVYSNRGNNLSKSFPKRSHVKH